MIPKYPWPNPNNERIKALEEENAGLRAELDALPPLSPAYSSYQQVMDDLALLTDAHDGLESENALLRVELQEAREANDALRPVTVESFDDIDEMPIGTVIRAEHWGDVAVRVRQRIWGGDELPTADDLLENSDDKFTTHTYWEVLGGGGLVDCDGPFTILYRGKEA